MITKSEIAPVGERQNGHGTTSIPPVAYEFLQGLFDGLRCGIVSVDDRGRIVLINELAARILDLGREGAVGKPADEVLAHHPRVAQVLRECFRMSCLPNRAEMELSSASGGCKTIGFTVSLVSPTEGGPVGAAMFFKDLTQIEHTEEQERLRDRLAALGQMAASLAHEIRNPLASIDVTCALLRRRMRAEASRDLLAKITAETRRVNRTVTSSLEFVRPMALRFAPAELTPVLHEAISVAESRCAGRVEMVWGPPVPRFLMDRNQLRQVFENLLLNGLQAAGERGTVRVQTEVLEIPDASVPYEPEGDRTRDPWNDVKRLAVVRIQDDGPGIPEEDRSKVFYPFFTTKEQGSGVGLSVARKIVDSHHGMIDVDAVPGGGALFTVRLPMVDDPAED